MIRKLFICILFLVIGALAQANLNLSPTLAGNKHTESDMELDALEVRVQALEDLLQYVTVEENPINGLNGPHIIITGANLHIRSGEGVTDGANTGVGNVVVGYNEEPVGGLLANDRDGTHNLIVGPEHRYLSSGGFIAGIRNKTSAKSASVSGGLFNTASGLNSSVSGGVNNLASGIQSSVSGGGKRTAPGNFNWAAGSLFENL